MLEGLSVWGPLVLGGILWFGSWRAGEATVFMRSWLPSWRFFENTGILPLLEYRTDDDGGASGWKPVPNPGRTSQDRLFHSPGANSFHAFETLVLEFAVNPAHPDLEDCVVSESIRRITAVHPGVTWIRFRLRGSDQSGRLEEVSWEGVWNSPRS